MDKVFAGNRHIRGWGYLTGQGSGAINLTYEEADFIAQARGDVPYLLDLVESSGALNLSKR